MGSALPPLALPRALSKAASGALAGEPVEARALLRDQGGDSWLLLVLTAKRLIVVRRKAESHPRESVSVAEYITAGQDGRGASVTLRVGRELVRASSDPAGHLNYLHDLVCRLPAVDPDEPWWVVQARWPDPVLATTIGGTALALPPNFRTRLVFSIDGVHMDGPTRSQNQLIDWSRITGVHVDGPEGLSERVTMTRMLALGLLAFAAKKKEGQTFLTLDTADGDAIFAVFGVDQFGLEQALSLVMRHYGNIASCSGRVQDGGSEPSDPIALLKRLADLHAAGVLSDEEFASKKAELLDRL